ncbi:MAG: hypothetical protein K5685_13370 [Bacteroidales bacterium]|nr:hypothetical protein [Bacteroidales bacterium]
MFYLCAQKNALCRNISIHILTLVSKNFSVEDIIDVTGLSADEIENL